MVRMMSSNVVKTIVMGKKLFILCHSNVYLKLLKRICTNNHLEQTLKRPLLFENTTQTESEARTMKYSRHT